MQSRGGGGGPVSEENMVLGRALAMPLCPENAQRNRAIPRKQEAKGLLLRTRVTP